MTTPTPPPAAPDATALEPLFYAMRTELITCDGIGKTEKQRIVESAITHLAAHAELQARCARLEEDGKQMRDALNFIVSECDWEEGTHTGDNRIGTACHEALAARTATIKRKE